MYLKILFFIALFVFSLTPNVLSKTALDVEVLGIEGKLHKNVMARLRIELYRQRSELTAGEIKRLHHLAEEDIKSALAPYGYYSVRVDGSLQETESGMLARYVILPGQQVYITTVSISVLGEGKDLKVFSKLQDLPGLKIGAILDQVLYEKGKKKLIHTATALGFLDAEFSTHEIRIAKKKNEAEIELVLDTGRRYLFGSTNSNQDIITEDLLLRFLPYQRGDFYSTAQLYQLQRDLYKTDYFSNVVVEGGVTDSQGEFIPVTIHLDPLEHYNQYSFGVGYATDTRLHALFEWENKLFNKQGHRLNLSLLVGELDSHCSLGYTVPVVDPRYNTIAYGTSWNREKWEETTTSLLSAGTSFEYKTPSFNYGISLELRDENYKIGNTSGASLILMPRVEGSWAIADDLVNTTNGFRATVSIGGGTEHIVSDVSFVKARGDGTLIITPFDGWRLIGRGAIGGILVDSINDIPPSLRFYTGGEKSVRGYKYRTLGPLDDSGALVGGTFLLTGSMEVERKLSKIMRAFAFYDVGNTMDDLSVDLVSGVGAGLGLVLPFGHVRCAIAYPLNNEGESQYFYLSVGADL